MDMKKKLVSLLIMAMFVPMLNTAFAADNSMLWNAEFDGNDDMSSWTKYTTSDAVDSKTFDFAALVDSGRITVGTKALNYGRMGFVFDEPVSVGNSENIYWETKFCFPEKVAANDDKMFMMNDSGVLISQVDGKLSYGGAYGDTTGVKATGFEMKPGVWYTLLVKMNFADDIYAIEIKGDDDSAYYGEYVSFAGEADLSSIDQIKLPRQRTSGLVTYYDYVRLWDEDKNFSVNVTYGANDSKLDSADGVKTEFDCKVRFTEAVAETELSGISIDNDGSMELTHFDSDGKTAQFHVSGLGYETEYTIIIPAIGNNPETTVRFTTQEYIPPEINVVYGLEDKELDGAVDVSKSALFKVLFEIPVTEADASQITIDKNAVLTNFNILDGGRTLTMNAEGLAGYTKYTITIPELGGNAGKEVRFTTVDDISYILKADFEGNDDASGYIWTPNRDTNNPKNLSSKISNGIMSVDRNDLGSQQLTLSFNDPVDVEGRENIFFEERVRFRMVTPAANGLVSSDTPIFNVFGITTNYQETVFAKNGKLAYGGTSPNNTLTDTDFEIKDNEWYTIRLHLDNTQRKFGVSMSDDNGNEYDGMTDAVDAVQNSYGLSIDKIYHLIFGYTAQLNIDIDYIKMWDSDIRISSSSIRNGATGVSNDSDLVLEFSKDVAQNTLNMISVNDQDGNLVPTQITSDTRTAVIYFTAGLRYDTDYTVTVPVSVTDSEGKSINETILSFKTEPRPLRAVNHGVKIEDGQAAAHVTVRNTTGRDKTVCIVMVVYDKDMKVTKMHNTSETVMAQSEKEIYSSCAYDSAEDVTVKAYVWNGMNN